MARFFIDRPIFAIVLAIMITLIGLISAFNLPVAQYPQITPPQVSVSATYPGANSDVVDQTIAQPIEQQVNGVEDMISMRSTSADNGTYSLQVQFELGKNADMATVQTQNRVSEANPSLPQLVQSTGVTTLKVSADRSFIFALYSPQGTYDGIFLKNYGDINIMDDIKRIKGVGDIGEFGITYAMRVWLRPDKMAQLKITVDDVAAVINQQNIQAPAGAVGQLPNKQGQQFQYTLRVKGRLTEPKEFANIIVRTNSDGSIIRLGDIAKVELAGQDYSWTSDTNGKPAAGFIVMLSPDANALTTVAEVRAVLAADAKKFPPDLNYKVVIDRTMFVRQAMIEVAKTLGEAMLLVLCVVFLFLQTWRATLIPMLAVPVSLIGTFGAFLALGFSINTLTLFAMVLAIGLVVDDAIVVIEAVEYHMRFTGLSPHDATVRAMSEVSGPVVAIAFVLASVFLPVAFLGGTMGVLYKQFALTVAVSMGLSALVALSLTPALCAMLLKPHDPYAHEGRLGNVFAVFNKWVDIAIDRYVGSLGKIIPKFRIMIAMLGVLVVLILILFTRVPSSFVPVEDLGYFITTVTLPEAASANRTEEMVNKVAAEIRKQPGVVDEMAISGYDFLGGGARANAGVVFAQLAPWDQRTDAKLSEEEQVRQVNMRARGTPEALIRSLTPPSLPGLGSTGGFTMMIENRNGATQTAMAQVSQEFLAAARKRPEIGLVYSTFNNTTPGYEFDVDREKSQQLGVPVSSVFTALQTFYGGYEVNQFNAFGRTYWVELQADPQFRADISSTRLIYVRSSSGTMVPLNTLIKPRDINSATLINRFNDYPSMQIGGEAAKGYSSGQALDALKAVALETLPVGFSYEWADASREEVISGSRAPYIFALSLLFVFLCLAALYESWGVPFAVLLCVPTGVFGAFLFQWAFNQQNNIYMQIGLIMLIGLAAKNAILIVEFAKVRVDRGMHPVAAAIEAAKIRLRPIVMTSLAFVIGCIPLAIATGAGAGARNSMGTAVVGGMLLATSIGIFLIPVLFVVIEKIALKIKSDD